MACSRGACWGRREGAVKAPLALNCSEKQKELFWSLSLHFSLICTITTQTTVPSHPTITKRKQRKPDNHVTPYNHWGHMMGWPSHSSEWQLGVLSLFFCVFYSRERSIPVTLQGQLRDDFFQDMADGARPGCRFFDWFGAPFLRDGDTGLTGKSQRGDYAVLCRERTRTKDADTCVTWVWHYCEY